MNNGHAVQAAAVVLVEGRRAGSAVLVGNRYVLTARHVLLRAGRMATADQVEVEFPAIAMPDGAKARVRARQVPPREGAGPVDAAVLDLGEQPPEWLPSPLALSPTRRVPKRVSVFGFPSSERELKGVWREFDTAGSTAVGSEQLDWVQPVGTLRGQSGGPVLDPHTGTVVGVLVEGSERGRFDRFIPAAVVSDCWPNLPCSWLMSGMDAAAAAEHFRLRARGQRSHARGGDVFCGRHAALAAARNWLTADEAPGRPLVLTGQPGAGKSAAIGRTVLNMQTGGVGPGLAFYSREATHFDLLTAVADLTGVDHANSTGDLIDALKARSDGPWLVVVDALDEASSSSDRREMSKLLTELAALPTLRVAVATRALTPGAGESRYLPGALLPALGVSSPDSPSLVDLDSDQFFEPAAVSDYAAALLEQSGADHPGPAGHGWSHYRSNTSLRDRLASTISARAGRNYLVAAMAADRLSTEPDVVNPDDPAFDPATIPASVSEALDKYLDGLEERHRNRVRGLLTALAYTRGTGIDDQMWLSFASALGYSVSVEDLDGLYDTSAADYLLQITPSDDGAPVTRLFHQALADDLLRRRRHRLGDERALLDVLLPSPDGGWEQASAYARSHAGDHAAACKRLATLLQDPHYLAVADLTRLLPLLPTLPDLREAPIISVLRQIAVEATPLTPLLRMRLLALTAARNGLHELHHHLATACRNGLAPRWGQPLGAPHQTLRGR
ncbi:trypsin-like serine peptidase [Streptomyces canus]|uniref:trypsin-like serine peptidase n=1 Tax=Streptomyces canus TaxID=58343 RepID=UPI002783365C|nr:serine protease [Streptomyces canus]MDQ0765355.1 V8-like Glu-specific endopeptidase [Streptomyces canus]